MKIVIAIDSLKGSLSSMEAGKTIEAGILEVIPEATTIVRPLADGGEGTVEALIEGMGGKLITKSVSGPLMEKVDCSYGIVSDRRLAIIEMAGAAGLTLVPQELRNPMNTTTYGVGEVILDAIDKGCREFIIGIGGSATNDGGLGMLQALGFEFFDINNRPVEVFGKDLATINYISTEKAEERLKECTFKVACDVNNPLYGPKGAAKVYGPQKGATEEVIDFLDDALKRYAYVANKTLDCDFDNYPGAGAAGGLGYAFKTFLNADLEPGISIILEAINLEESIKEADIIITGEGRLDFQTAMGKAPIGVAKLAKKYHKKVIAFAGGITEGAAQCNEEGIDAYFSIIQQPMALEEAMQKDVAAKNLKASVAQVFRLIEMFDR